MASTWESVAVPQQQACIPSQICTTMQWPFLGHNVLFALDMKLEEGAAQCSLAVLQAAKHNTEHMSLADRKDLLVAVPFRLRHALLHSTACTQLTSDRLSNDFRKGIACREL